MTLVRVMLVPHKRYQKHSRKVALLVCDTCNVDFERSCTPEYANKDYHFCSKACVDHAAKKGGVLCAKKVATSQVHYGTDHPLQSDAVKAHVNDTNMIRYGVKWAIQDPNIRAKSEATNMIRYGVSNVMSSPEIQRRVRETTVKHLGVDSSFKSPTCIAKREQTWLEKYGNSVAMRSETVKNAIRLTNRERYGVDYFSQTQEHNERCIKTCLERYGVEHYAQTAEYAKQYKSSCLERYGVEHVFQLPSVKALCNSALACQKRHETMKRNGTYAKSMSEDRFYEDLCECFGVDSIDRAVPINGWPIDFYVRSIGTYVQFDGDYWHGHDRPLVEISTSTGKRDAVIYRKWQTDREQEAWFARNDLRLVRILESSWNKDPQSTMSAIVDGALL